MRVRGESLTTEHISNCGPVISIAHNQGRLFVAGNCCVNMFAMNDGPSAVDPVYRPFGGIIVSSRQELDALDAEIRGVENKIASLKTERSGRLQSLKEEARLEEQHLDHGHHFENATISSQLEDLRSAISEMKTDLSMTLDELSAQQCTALSSCNIETKKKCAKEMDNIAAFEAWCDQLRRDFQNEIVTIKAHHADNILSETEVFHDQMTKANNRCEEIINATEALKLDLCKKGEIVEQRTTMKIVALNKSHDNELRELKRSNQLLLNEVRFRIRSPPPFSSESQLLLYLIH
jgi:hypothetical protein